MLKAYIGLAAIALAVANPGMVAGALAVYYLPEIIKRTGGSKK